MPLLKQKQITNHSSTLKKKKTLNDCPLREQRLLLRVQRYNLSVIYTPGKQLAVEDALSRVPDNKAALGETGQIRGLDDVMEAYVDMVIKTMPVSDNRFQEIQKATLSDQQLNSLQKVILDGWPKAHYQFPKDVRPFGNVRDEMSVVNAVVFTTPEL